MIYIVIVIVMAVLAFFSRRQSTNAGKSGGHDKLTVLCIDPLIDQSTIALHFSPDHWKVITEHQQHQHRNTNKHRNNNASLAKTSVDFVFGLATSAKHHDHIVARLKNRLDASQMTDKALLHKHLEGIIDPTSGRPLIAPTILLDADTKMPDAAVWIIRANWGWKGLAADVVTDDAELRAAYSRQSSPSTDARKSPATTRVIASEYIINPLLWNKRKFHVRFHAIVYKISADQPARAAILTGNTIMPAAEPYIPGDWQNKKIHDTHHGSSADTGEFSADDPLHTAGRSVIAQAIRHLLPTIALYPESGAAYELIGADVMYYADGSAVLLELNKRPGLDADDVRQGIVREYITGILGTIGIAVFGTDAFCDLPNNTSLMMVENISSNH